MALQGVIGNGSKVLFSASSPATWTQVGQLRDIPQFMSLIADDLDTTVSSTSNIMTGAPGMVPVPECSIDLLSDHDPSTSPSHETLRQYQAASGFAVQGTNLYWRVEVPVNRGMTLFRAFEFQAYVKEYTPNIQIKDLQITNIKIRFAGGWWVTAAAGASAV